MEKLSMKTMDIGFQTAGNVKASQQTADVSGDYDFRKMLQSKNEDAQGKQDSKEVSKDQNKDTATDKTEATGNQKQEVSEEQGKTEQTDSSETDTRQAEVMIALQIRERYSYGFTGAVQETEEQIPTDAVAEVTDGLPEIGAEEGVQMPETAEQGAVLVQNEEQAQQAQMPETGRVQTVKPQQAAEQPEQMQKTADVKTAEAMPVIQTQDSAETKPQTQDFTSNLKETAKTVVQPEEKTDAQPEHFAAEQAAAAVRPEAEQSVRTEVERPETAARVYVEQPEELPEKVTDTLLAKLVEGVKEFEIHIEPVNLGKIAVKVLYEGNQATISIVCSEKRAMDALSQNAREIGNIIDRNLGGETTIIVDKQETDYLNQTRDENEQTNQNQRQKEEKSQNQDGEDAEQFLQRLRLGLTG